MRVQGAEITGYQLSILGDRAVLEVMGEQSAIHNGQLPMARIDFRSDGELRPAFTNRGGFMQASCALEVLGPIMDMLRHDSPVFIDDDGNFSTSSRGASSTE